MRLVAIGARPRQVCHGRALQPRIVNERVWRRDPSHGCYPAQRPHVRRSLKQQEVKGVSRSRRTATQNGFLSGYGPIAREGWEETIRLYRLYHALEWWDWVALIGAERPAGLIEEMEPITASM